MSLAGFTAAVFVAQSLLVPVIYRLNEGRFDWRRVRTGAAQWFVQGMLIVAVLLAFVGVYQLEGSLFGGWPGSRRDAAVGALIGGILGLPLGLGVAQFRMAERWRAHNHRP